jgi:hypothetical protein
MGAGLTEIVLALASFRSKFSWSCCSWDAELLVAGIIPLELLYERCPTPNQRAISSRSDGFLRKVNAQHGRSQTSIFLGACIPREVAQENTAVSRSAITQKYMHASLEAATKTADAPE